MLVGIERSSLEQGRGLAHGFAWNLTAERRARSAIALDIVPLAIGPAHMRWGLPSLGGVLLSHP